MDRITEMRELAKQEAIKLKQNATPDELARLDKEIFEPTSFHRCIYGMMTSDCQTPRALELINLCCEKVYVTNPNSGHAEDNILNGSPRDIECPVFSRVSHYTSPIETLIFPKMGGKADGYKIIDFLKGETEELNFS